jgi:hypothetical protein
MADVTVVTKAGNTGTVPEEALPAALARGAKVQTAEEAQAAKYGGPLGNAIAATLGALDAASMGGGTALAVEMGRDFGGPEGQVAVEQAVRGYKTENPISHVLGEAAPLALGHPEFAEAEMAQLLPKAAGYASRFARFAAPKAAMGAADMARLEAGEAISEGVLDHDLSAESYWAHIKPGNILMGGLLNVGIAGGFEGLGKVHESFFGKEFGKLGAASINDARVAEEAIAAGHKRGLTSDFAQSGLRDLHAASLIREHAVGMGDKAGELYADTVAERVVQSAPPEQRAVFKRHWEAIKDPNADEAAVFTRHANEIAPHVNTVLHGEAELNDMIFGGRSLQVRELIDASPARLARQRDAALRLIDTMDATLFGPELPRAPRIPEFKPPEFKLPKGMRKLDPLDPRIENAKAWHEAAVASSRAEYDSMVAEKLGAHERLLQEITEKHAASVDRELLAMVSPSGEPLDMSLRFSNADRARFRGTLGAMRRNVARSVELGESREAAALTHSTINEAKQLVGQIAKFGRESSGSTGQNIADLFYRRLFQPFTEDSAVWGERLAAAYKSTNAAFYDDGMRKLAVEGFGNLGSRVDTPLGRPRFSADIQKIESHLRRLGERNASSEFNVDIRSVEQALDHVKQKTQALRRYKLTPAESERLNTIVKAAEDTRLKLEAVKKDAQEFRARRELREREGRSGIGGVLGRVVDFATNPMRSLETVAGFRRLEKSVRAWFDGEAKGVLKGGPPPPPAPAITTKIERDAVIRAMEDVRKYRANPRILGESLKAALGDVGPAAPVMTSAIATVAARTVAYLARHLPEPLPARLTDPSNEPRYADADIDDFHRRFQLATDPKMIMRKVRAGHMHAEDRDLMQECFPSLYEGLRQTVLREIVTAKAKGQLRTLSYAEQQNLSALVGAPLDDTQKIEFVMVMQQTAATDPNNQAAHGRAAQGGGRPRNVTIDTDRMKTLDEHLQEN